MPIAGQGAIPDSGAVYNELTAVTRRAFIPKLVVQLYFASPSLFYLMGSSQKSSGGLNPITVPVQGQSMVQGAFTGYGGQFNSPAVTPGILNAQFPTAYWVVPVPIPFGETMIQSTEAIIPVLKARMNDVWSVTYQEMSTLLFSNNSANNLLPSGFVEACDDGTNVATYGGISRTAAGNSFWKGQYLSRSSLTDGWTRQAMSSFLIQVTDAAGGEAPTFVVMNPADFATLNADFIGAEQIFTNPGESTSMSVGARSSFPNLNVSGVPIYADHFCPKGSAYAINSKYTSMYLSEDAAFDFSGFYSLVPLGQMGQQGVVLTGYNVISTKPKANAVAYGFGGAAY